ncbi:MAG TPA: HAD family hydrolase, partial [Acidobacteriota bacterium]|nr:HAD family hydrolase [Acidobacteriota bacterium]
MVKRLSAVETLGATTVILTDKTGTLTENEMTIREVWASGTHFTISGVGYGVEGVVEPSSHEATVVELLRTAALCCDARLVPPNAERTHWGIIGDPMEAAILVAATKVGLTEEKLTAWPRLVELPFDSTRKRMTIIHQIDGQPVACVKGVPSQLLARSSRIRWNGTTRPFDDAHQQTIQTIHDTIARRGLRLLGVAIRELNTSDQPVEGWQVEEVESDLTFLGLLAMEDPPRPEVPAALAACREAQIQVVMVTGDNGLTATAIAQEIGMYQGEVQVITGDQLDHTSRPELLHLLDNPNVLIARATPEHKLRLVEAFQQRGEVVAVTGDGVNDAPALKRADIG